MLWLSVLGFGTCCISHPLQHSRRTCKTSELLLIHSYRGTIRQVA